MKWASEHYINTCDLCTIWRYWPKKLCLDKSLKKQPRSSCLQSRWEAFILAQGKLPAVWWSTIRLSIYCAMLRISDYHNIYIYIIYYNHNLACRSRNILHSFSLFRTRALTGKLSRRAGGGQQRPWGASWNDVIMADWPPLSCRLAIDHAIWLHDSKGMRLGDESSHLA